jgi:START domain
MSLKTKTYTIIALLSIIFTKNIVAQDNCKEWKIKENKGTLKVYVRECPDSPIKEFKVNDKFSGDFNKLVAEMEKPEVVKKMSEYCTEARDLQHLSDHESVQYYYFDMPIGITDRDVISKITKYKTATTFKSITETYPSNLVPTKKGVVRLDKVRTSFYFEKQADGSIAMEYIGRTDPNGWIPAWLINYLAQKEATKVVSKIQKLINN